MAVIRQRTQVFNQPVGVVRANAGGEQVGLAISRAADTMAQLAFRTASEEAEKKGIDIAQAVEEERLRTINPETGKPEPFTPPKSFGRIAATAYQQVIDKRFEDSVSDELKLKAREFAEKYKFDPNSYDDVFSDYISNMSKNAQGKYKVFIESTGTKYLALTKLNIQEQVNARARANLAASISTGIDEDNDKAYSAALAGGFMKRVTEEVSESSAIRDRSVAAASDAIKSGLFKSGTDKKARRELNASIAKGGSEYILSGTASKAERDAVALAIRTRGVEMSGLPKNLQAEIKELLNYIEPSNINAVLGHMAGVASDYNAVEANLIAQQEDQAALQSREFDLQLSNAADNLGNLSTGLSISGFYSSDETGVDIPFAIQGSVNQANANYNSVNSALESRFRSDKTYTEAELKSDQQEARRASLQPFLIQAALQGNIDELKTAIVTGSPKDMVNLTPRQRDAVIAIRSSDLYDAIDDREYVNSVLSASNNSIQEQADKQRLQYDLNKMVNNFGEAASQGAVTQDDLDDVIASIKKNIGPKGLSAEQAIKQEGRARSQYGIGLVERFAATASSQDMNGLERYVDSNGEDTRGVSQAAIEAGNEILGAIEGREQVDAVISKAKGLKAAISQAEEVQRKQAEKQVIAKSIISGVGDANSAEHRKVAQEMLDNLQFDLTKFNQYTGPAQRQIMNIVRSAPPEKLVDGLNQIISGQATAGAESLLDIFAQMETGVADPFGNSLTLVSKEFLRDVNNVRIIEGGNIQEIAMRLNKARRDEGKANLEANLGGKSLNKFTEEILGVADPVLAEELSSVVEYNAMAGKSADEIKKRVTAILDQKYAKSQYIADPMRPAGSVFRSRYSLQAVFPDADVRNHFIQTVESQLPTGYSLAPDAYQSALAIAESQGYATDSMKEKATNKKVYLVPVPTTAKPVYIAHFVDENNELRPLIYEKDGQMIWPQFSQKDIQPFLDQKAYEAQQALEDKLDRDEQAINALRKRPRMK